MGELKRSTATASTGKSATVRDFHCPTYGKKSAADGNFNAVFRLDADHVKMSLHDRAPNDL